MKKFTAALLALCLMLCLAACGAGTETIYVQTESVRTVWGKEIRTEYTYSDSGKPLTTKVYFEDALYSTTRVRTSGGVTYLTLTDANGNESTQSQEYTYDDRGNVLKLTQSSGGSVFNRVTYTYDDKDNCLTSESVTSSGTTKISYTYNENGKLVTSVTSCEETKEYRRVEYVYNADGYATREAEYDAEGNMVAYTDYAYSSDYKTATATLYEGDGTANGTVITYVYDENKNLIEKTTTIDGEVAEHVVNTYIALEVPVKD